MKKLSTLTAMTLQEDVRLGGIETVNYDLTLPENDWGFLCGVSCFRIDRTRIKFPQDITLQLILGATVRLNRSLSDFSPDEDGLPTIVRFDEELGTLPLGEETVPILQGQKLLLTVDSVCKAPTSFVVAIYGWRLSSFR